MINPYLPRILSYRLFINLSFFVFSAYALAGEGASWRDHYLLGPGDRVKIFLYGYPETLREGVVVGPGGGVSYLEVVEVPVAGKTLDEARCVLEASLAEYHIAPHIILTPGEVRSKRYTMMGKVMEKGVFNLEAPLTLSEALARCGGFEVGLINHGTTELADMDRSFVMRSGEKLDINFKRLFLEGDMSQNKSIEPGDYIFIASSVTNEFYVFGSVGIPGPQTFMQHTTMLSALAQSGGWQETAALSNVLVVRGSLDKPETFLVNVKAILNGKAADFILQPKDIVYVSDRATLPLELLAERAVNAFVLSSTTSWVNANMPQMINKSYLPRLNTTVNRSR